VSRDDFRPAPDTLANPCRPDQNDAGAKHRKATGRLRQENFTWRSFLFRLLRALAARFEPPFLVGAGARNTRNKMAAC